MTSVKHSSNGRKLQRRLALLRETLEITLKAGCLGGIFCRGPFAPYRHMLTCARCACVHRAWRMGLLKRDGDVFTVTDVPGNSA